MADSLLVECSICGAFVPESEVCSTLACRACHKKESLEDCRNNVQVNRIRAAYGLSPLEHPCPKCQHRTVPKDDGRKCLNCGAETKA